MDIVNQRRKTFFQLYSIPSVIHIIFSVVFFVEKSYFLAIFNLILMFVYLTLGRTARKTDNYRSHFIVGTVVMTLFLVVHYLILGSTFGFQYISIGAIPLIFFASYDLGKDAAFSKKMAYIAFAVFGVVVLTGMLISYPIVSISEIARRFIVGCNIVNAFFMAIQFMTLFVAKTAADADALENKNVDLEVSANIDALTGLKNRRSVEAYISNVIKMTKGYGKEFSFLMCDIDNFKSVNDTYGHDCGDQILQNVAGIIKREIRAEDVAFRWGGEEIFIVINGKRHVAKEVAERCRKSIEDSHVVYQGQEIRVTITIGGSSYYQGATRDVLVKKADDNLYIGKNNGKNQVVM